ncbi:hypothetical protein IVB43_23675 [Bradyrhizobium sp. 48]|uniref:hypothetical protein n=1 Tax=Bradyrhizobium sp. 48 TaxID=2782676 RepID=UPI001FF91796|nr:hypothetical protein [Bradyrhizobium sp. 48]MCK1445388.1 hypothetical protein [Bradyrhizobium sp. 48]
MSDILARLESHPDDLNPVLKQEAAAEIRRLRQGIQDYLDGDYGRDYFHTARDKCPHGLFRWESCENCIDAHFTKLLASEEHS